MLYQLIYSTRGMLKVEIGETVSLKVLFLYHTHPSTIYGNYGTEGRVGVRIDDTHHAG